MKTYQRIAKELTLVRRAAIWNPGLRQLLNAAPLVVMFLLLNTRTVQASCSFNPAPDPTADGSSNSLRHAIQMANASGEDCTIELQAGTYTLTIKNTHGQENAAAEGDLDITDSGHTTTVLGQGVGVSIVNGNGIDRVFQVRNNANAEFRYLTIKGGVARDDGGFMAQPGKSEAKGGGILVQGGGHVDLYHVQIRGNRAIGGPGGTITTSLGSVSGTPGQTAAGGGLFLAAGTVYLTGSKVSGNIAVGGTAASKSFLFSTGGIGAGGGLYLHSGSVELISSTVSVNKAYGGRGRGSGGGTAQGAGLFAEAGALLTTQTTISSNSGFGGASTVNGYGGGAQGAACSSAAEVSA